MKWRYQTVTLVVFADGTVAPLNSDRVKQTQQDQGDREQK